MGRRDNGTDNKTIFFCVSEGVFQALSNKDFAISPKRDLQSGERIAQEFNSLSSNSSDAIGQDLIILLIHLNTKIAMPKYEAQKLKAS